MKLDEQINQIVEDKLQKLMQGSLFNQFLKKWDAIVVNANDNNNIYCALAGYPNAEPLPYANKSGRILTAGERVIIVSELSGFTNAFIAFSVTSGEIPPVYLPVASSTVLGGIKVGKNLTINPESGILDANSSGEIPTAEQVLTNSGESVENVLSKKADWNDGFIQAGSIKAWAEAKTINTGIATSPDTTDVPYASFWMVNVYIYPAGGWKLLTATCVINGEQFYAIKNLALPWTDWFKVLTTATPITEHDFPLTSGFTKNGDCVFFKTQDGIVHCVGSVAGNFIQAENHFATLPSGFRPKAIFALPATGRNVECSAIVMIRPEGTVTFWPEKVCQAAYFSFTFVAAG